MARPKSDDKRDAIMAAAMRVIAAQGLGAPTATIAREAGVANGSLFNYFPTKTDLLNQLYCALKADMAAASMADLPAEADIRDQTLHMWRHWLNWAVACPDKRRVLAYLGVSSEITPESRQAGHETMAGIAGLLDRSRAGGPMGDAPLAFLAALMSALADTTIDFIIADPAQKDQLSIDAFDAMWRMLT